MSKSYHTAKQWVGAFFAVVVVLSSPNAVRAQAIFDLGDLGLGTSFATGVNDSGQVVGYAFTGTAGGLYNTYSAFLYSDGTTSSLGTLGGGFSKAYGINNSGQVVGESTLSNGQYDAFVYSGGKMTSLGNLGGNGSAAYAINNSGQIVGTSYDSTNDADAFLYSGGKMTSLAHIGAFAYGINKSGQVVGSFGTTVGADAFLYTGGTTQVLPTLGTTSSGYSYSAALGINESGQVVGQSTTSNGSDTAFLYANGVLTNLGTLGGDSYANAINNLGQVVGFCNLYDPTAFIYTKGTGMVSLNTIYSSLLVSGSDSKTGFISLSDATSINNEGEIVGQGSYWNGTSVSQKAFLLDPVPEPSTLALLLSGCGLLALLHQRKAPHNKISEGA